MHTQTIAPDDSPKTLHRVGSLLGKDLDNPKTIGQRITARRLALNMTQEQVAERCWITQKSNSQTTGLKAGDRKKLSRSAYCMYETDSVAPVIDVLEQIAAVLSLSREYVFFGTPTIEEIAYKASEDDFPLQGHWNLNADWVKRNFHHKPEELVLARLTQDGLAPAGSMAVIQRGTEPGRSVQPFVFAVHGELTSGYVSRPSRGGLYQVFATPKARTPKARYEAYEINIVGKMVGQIGALTE